MQDVDDAFQDAQEGPPPPPPAPLNNPYPVDNQMPPPPPPHALPLGGGMLHDIYDTFRQRQHDSEFDSVASTEPSLADCDAGRVRLTSDPLDSLFSRCEVSVGQVGGGVHLQSSCRLFSINYHFCSAVSSWILVSTTI